MQQIKLTDDNSITKKQLNDLSKWIKTTKQLTKGPIVKEFENKWSNFIGQKYSTMTNSGSSANLLMINELKKLELNSNKVVVPAICWSTTISPLIQLGFEPVICDVDKNNLGLDPEKLKEIVKKENIGAVILVHTLGIPSKIADVYNITKEKNIVLLEDSCESIGSTYDGKLTGSFGAMSTFSFYFSHHLTTIEGGMICTSNEYLSKFIKMSLEHGWDRGLEKSDQQTIRKHYKIDNFRSLYTFYHDGYNLRSTDLNAFIGIEQLKNLNVNLNKRRILFKAYMELLDSQKLAVDLPKEIDYKNLCPFAYPIIHKNKDRIVKKLSKNKIDSRPLVCGNIVNHPAFKTYKKYNLENADIIDKYGFYLPLHPGLKINDIKRISTIINGEV